MSTPSQPPNAQWPECPGSPKLCGQPEIVVPSKPNGLEVVADDEHRHLGVGGDHNRTRHTFAGVRPVAAFLSSEPEARRQKDALECPPIDRRGWLWVTGSELPTHSSDRFLCRFEVATRTWDWFEEDRGYGGEHVNAFCEDSQGRIWLGTQRGLKRFDGHQLEDFGAATGLGDENVSTILEDREGRLWIGVVGGGLRCLDPTWTAYTKVEGLPANGVTRLLETGGHLLVGTKEGLSRLRRAIGSATSYRTGRAGSGLRPRAACRISTASGGSPGDAGTVCRPTNSGR